jgi:hypothetical protein
MTARRETAERLSRFARYAGEQRVENDRENTARRRVSIGDTEFDIPFVDPSKDGKMGGV